MTAFDRDNLSLIFTALTDWWLKKWSYSQNITRLAKPLVAATIDVYEQVRTPPRAHVHASSGFATGMRNHRYRYRYR